MSSFDQESLKNLKELSRIDCTEEEEGRLLNGITKVLSHIENLQSIDTETVMPTVIVTDGTDTPMREDLVSETLDRKTFLDNAPDQVAGMIRTPQVMESNTP